MAYSTNQLRRRLLGAGLSALGLALVSAVPAAQRLLTPRQSRGPFYPRRLPLDKDNDLVTVTGKTGIAQGQIAHIFGRILDEKGRPLSGIRVEIWQCDSKGQYHHVGNRWHTAGDPNFQGYGQFVTGADGGYRFRTIKPVPYPGRAPHIHFALSGPGVEPLTTQMYVAGAPENKRDFLLNSISNPNARKQLIVPLEASSPNGELEGSFNIVLAADERFSRMDRKMLPFA